MIKNMIKVGIVITIALTLMLPTSIITADKEVKNVDIVNETATKDGKDFEVYIYLDCEIDINVEYLVMFSVSSYAVPPLTYRWDFGDGTTDTQSDAGFWIEVPHTYTNLGEKTISVTVTDANQGSATDEENTWVTEPGTFHINAGGDVFNTYYTQANEEIQLSGNAYGGLPPYEFKWDFDDSDGIQVESTSQYPSTTYNEDGEYIVTLKVDDQVPVLPRELTSTATVIVDSVPPVYSWTHMPTVAYAGLPAYVSIWTWDEESRLRVDAATIIVDGEEYSMICSDHPPMSPQNFFHYIDISPYHTEDIIYYCVVEDSAGNIVTTEEVTLDVQRPPIINLNTLEIYDRIRAAVQEANDYDTIFVRSGTYDILPVVIDKPLTLRGESKLNTILDGSCWNGFIRIESTEQVKITGFTFKNSVCLIEDSNDCTIENNIFKDNNIPHIVTNGILLMDGDSNTILHNIFRNNNYGISLFAGSCDNFIFGNEFRDNHELSIEIMLSSDNNRIYYNNFFHGSSEIQHVFDSCINQWDSGAKGNYWQHFNEDDPGYPYYYEVPGGRNRDNHPSLDPWPLAPLPWTPFGDNPEVI